MGIKWPFLGPFLGTFWAGPGRARGRNWAGVGGPGRVLAGTRPGPGSKWSKMGQKWPFWRPFWDGFGGGRWPKWYTMAAIVARAGLRPAPKWLQNGVKI